MKFDPKYSLNDKVQVYQVDAPYRFNEDSILLSYIVDSKKDVKVIDIGAGSGIISVLLAKLKGFQQIDAVEAQEKMYECLVETVRLNNLEQTIRAVFKDIREYKPNCHYDIAIANPPYTSKYRGRRSSSSEKDMARSFGDDCGMGLDDIFSFCKKYLKFGKYLYFSYPTELLTDAACSAREYGFEIKDVTFVCFKQHQKKISLIKAKYGGGVGLTIHPTIDKNDEVYSKIMSGIWE